jgi:hypothetical protein
VSKLPALLCCPPASQSLQFADPLCPLAATPPSLANCCSWGWRISLGLAAVPASILTLGGIILPDSPNSLIERGHLERGRKVLESIRGTQDVDAGGRCVEWAGRVSVAETAVTGAEAG